MMALKGENLKGLRKRDIKGEIKYIIPHENKKSTINVDGRKYERVLVKTHVIRIGETFDQILKKYVLENPEYKKSDLVGIGDKVTCILQNRVKNIEDVKPSGIANFLSRFVGKRYGNGIGNPYKMQLAIENVGLLKILIAAALSAITKIFGIHGVFYHVAGREVGRYDGFGGHSWYRDFGTLGPENPQKLANEIYKKYKIKFFLPDANNFGCNVLGKAEVIDLPSKTICQILRDNPAGNFDEQTPIMFLRPVK